MFILLIVIVRIYKKTKEKSLFVKSRNFIFSVLIFISENLSKETPSIPRDSESASAHAKEAYSPVLKILTGSVWNQHRASEPEPKTLRSFYIIPRARCKNQQAISSNIHLLGHVVNREWPLHANAMRSCAAIMLVTYHLMKFSFNRRFTISHLTTGQ